MKPKLKLFLLLLCISYTSISYGQESLVFKFKKGSDSFYQIYQDNEHLLERLFSYIDTNKIDIMKGLLPIKLTAHYKHGTSDDYAIAATRAKRIKSEMITRRELKEEFFQTSVRLSNNNRLVNSVIVELPKVDTANRHANTNQAGLTEEDRNKKNEPESIVYSNKENDSISAHYEDLFVSPLFRIKSNMLVNAIGVANVGVEYFFDNHLSLDLSFYYSPYTISRNYKIRVLALQPELRYWFNDSYSKHFVGTHFSLGYYNIAFGNNRYQDTDGTTPAWGAGLTYGYNLKLCKKLGMEFTAGLGYLRLNYDSFYNVANGAKIETKAYHYWGPTKLGVSIVYQINK